MNEKNKSSTQDLGWMNSWNETPEIVLNCQKAGHTITNVDVGTPHRGIEHVVKCNVCNYVYRYDSSD